VAAPVIMQRDAEVPPSDPVQLVAADPPAPDSAHPGDSAVADSAVADSAGADSAGADPFAVTVQRQAELTVQAAAAAEPARGAAGGEPEELLATLYDPLLRRLKAELRIDRDRYGSLTDLRG
jgi:hypothetical protein